MNPSALPLLLLLVMPEAIAAAWHTLQTGSAMTLQATEPYTVTLKQEEAEKQKETGKKIRIWGKISYPHPQQAKPGDFFYASEKMLLEINCSARTHQLLQQIYYDSDGQEFKVIRHDEKAKGSPLIPDSRSETLFDFACNYKSRAAKSTSQTPRTKPQNATPQPASPAPAGKEKMKETPSAKTATSPAKPSGKATPSSASTSQAPSAKSSR